MWPNSFVSAGAAQSAVRAYVFVALPLLPALVPLSVLMLEPRGARLRRRLLRCSAPSCLCTWPSSSSPNRSG
ncbi:hypothetical protein [Mycobacterium sp. 4858]|uniref:hypothetical protein n=1 Tax=Mycobacterium sp. 4858 TaxID=2057185 RepID=UPI00350EA5DD